MEEEERRIIYVKHVSRLHRGILAWDKPTVYQGGSDVRHIVVGRLEPFLGVTALARTILLGVRLGGRGGKRIGLDARRARLTVPDATAVGICRMWQGDGLVGWGPPRMGVWRKMRRQKGPVLLFVHGCDSHFTVRNPCAGKAGVGQRPACLWLWSCLSTQAR